jgi:succinate dehydrogenase / fumarate reductase cytochrome b subunit
MSSISNLVKSTIGSKLFMGISGLMLSGFIVVHLLGNLTLLYPDNGVAFNLYAHTLMSLGMLIYVAEFILAAIFLIHFYYGIAITLANRRARGSDKYDKVTGAGHTSRKSFASKTMIFTGIILMVFLIKHLNDLKFGSVYMTTIDGEEVRDLYKTTVEFFKNIWNVGFYSIVMILLGFHLSHGFWSAFQSIGIDGKKFTPAMVSVAAVFGIAMAVGFLFIPIYLYIYA